MARAQDPEVRSATPLLPGIEPESAPSAPPPAKSRAKPYPLDLDGQKRRDCRAWWEAAWAETRPGAGLYVWSPAASQGLIRSLGAACWDVGVWEAMARRLLESSDRFEYRKASPQYLASAWNELACGPMAPTRNGKLAPERASQIYRQVEAGLHKHRFQHLFPENPENPGAQELQDQNGRPVA